MITHHHRDHIGGLDASRERYGAPIWAHPETASRVDFDVNHYLHDGDVIDLQGGQTWQVLFTPGHAPGHICLCETNSSIMVVGDMVAGLGSILVEPSEGCMSDYLESLVKLREKNPTCLLPAHGPYIANPIEKLNQYIQHRLAREQSLLMALEKTTKLLELVSLVYADTPQQLRAGPTGGLAGLSLLAHLKKLVQEGRVSTADNLNWTLVSENDGTTY